MINLEIYDWVTEAITAAIPAKFRVQNQVEWNYSSAILHDGGQVKKQFSKCLQRRNTLILVSTICSCVCVWCTSSINAVGQTQSRTAQPQKLESSEQKSQLPDIDDYLGKVADRVLIQLHRPKTAGLKSSWSLRIYENGQFAYLRRTHESGSESYDEEIRKAIESSGPFPKLPPGLGSLLPREEFAMNGKNLTTGIDVELAVTSAEQGASCHCQLAPKVP